MPHRQRSTVLAALLLCACASPEPEGAGGSAERTASQLESSIEPMLRREMARIDSAAASIDAIFQPLPLLTPGEEESLREFSSARQLVRARELGIARGLPADRLATHERDGRLVRLADGNYWVIRDLDYSQPLVVPGVRDLLTEIGERFHARLVALGSPRFRFEISSGLRTASDQAALRRVNPNAALGESTHEYGTTVDIPYNAFAAPAEPLVRIDAGEAEWALPYLGRYAETVAERVGARRAMEIKAILGQVLLEMQKEGTVMVTLERQQPVYHLTLAMRAMSGVAKEHP